MTTSGTNASPEYASPHQSDTARPLRRPSLAAWIALGLAADASLILAFHVAIQPAVPGRGGWWQITASVAAFAAVPWLVHRTALPWLLVAIPATLWGRVSYLVCAVPYAVVSAVAAQIAVFVAFFFGPGLFINLILEGLRKAGFVSRYSTEETAALGLVVMCCGASGGAICGLLLHIGHTIRVNPIPLLIRLRTDLLGGAFAGASGSAVLILADGNVNKPYHGASYLLAATPFEVAVLLVVTGTFALLPHLILTGLDARAIPAASRN